jgi:hypothetical protein
MTFVPGGRYRNNSGEYTVLELRGNKMRVRMDDGREQNLTINIQQAVWARLKRDVRNPIASALGQVRDARRQHQAARARNDMRAAMHYRAELVEAQVRFCTLIRKRTPDEVTQLRRYFDTAARSDQRHAWNDYRNVCWACHTDISAGSNTHCDECGWLVCGDGACQCPDFSEDFGGNQPVCRAQLERLGQSNFTKLVQLRQAGTAAETN